MDQATEDTILRALQAIVAKLQAMETSLADIRRSTALLAAETPEQRMALRMQRP